ncbi:MAG: hypothetical protein Q9172_007164 [Xanthocarpia lactea]
MTDWNNDNSWSGGAAAAGSSSWNAGAEPSSDWDTGIKDSKAQAFDADGFADGAAETNPMDNTGGGGDDRACRM